MPALVTSTLPDAITQKLNDYVAKHTPHTFPACDLVVLHRGEQVLQGAWGTCEGIAPQADRRWDIASLTKLFTTPACCRCARKASWTWTARWVTGCRRLCAKRCAP